MLWKREVYDRKPTQVDLFQNIGLLQNLINPVLFGCLYDMYHETAANGILSTLLAHNTQTVNTRITLKTYPLFSTK